MFSYLLLCVGTCLAFPQYGPEVQSEIPETDALAQRDKFDFADGHKQTLEDYWWKVTGIFGDQNKEVRSDLEPGAGVGGPFTPQQSSFCQTGFDCIPWGICIDGYISPEGGFELQQRSKPAEYDTLQCGQEGNICCGIPEDILASHKVNVEGLEIVPESDVIQEPVETAAILEDIPESNYDEASAPFNEETEVIKSYDSSIPIVPIIDQGKVSADLSKHECGHASYDCVPYFQCINGVINTDGRDLIDVRIKPQGVCTNLDYPDVPAVCCLIPGSEPTPAPVETCPKNKECLEQELCSQKGASITDGSGIFDIRTGIQSCYIPSGNNGICCIPPALDFCPGNSICTPKFDCLGKALNNNDEFLEYEQLGTFASCLYGERDGVCCILPSPEVIDICPGNSECILGDQCSGQALDGSNNFVDYISSGTWTYCSLRSLNGICCRSKPTGIIDSCPGESLCLKPEQCIGTALDKSSSFLDYSSDGLWTHCSQYDQGVCCINPYNDPALKPATECGIRNYNIDQRITSNHGANEAAFGEFPWQSIIFYKNYTFNCGASLISHKHLITAAHCVNNLLAGDIKIRFGEWQVNSFDEPLPYVDYDVYAIHIHPNFNPKNVHNDLAVLELLEPVEFQYNINSVCLPSPGHIFDPYTPCFATGWGKDSFTGSFQHILKKIDLPYIDHETCQNYLRKTRLGKYFRLDASFVCAGGEENKDACYGDGGGPLVCKDQTTSRYVLVGVTSWGIGCGTKDIPGVYADVQYFSEWVQKILLSQHQDTLKEHHHQPEQHHKEQGTHQEQPQDYHEEQPIDQQHQSQPEHQPQDYIEETPQGQQHQQQEQSLHQEQPQEYNEEKQQQDQNKEGQHPQDPSISGYGK